MPKHHRQSGNRVRFAELPHSYASSKASSPSQDSIAFSYQSGHREHNQLYEQPRSYREPTRFQGPAVARVVSCHILPGRHNRTRLGMCSLFHSPQSCSLPFVKIRTSARPDFSTLNCTFPLRHISSCFPTSSSTSLHKLSFHNVFFFHTISTYISTSHCTSSTHHCTHMSSQALTVWSDDPSQLTSEGDIAEDEPLAEPLYQQTLREPLNEQAPHHFASSSQYSFQSGMFGLIFPWVGVNTWTRCLASVHGSSPDLLTPTGSC